MATVRKEFTSNIQAEKVWSAVRDIGALHTRLVPGFVVDTRVEGTVRIVTFGNGMVVREPIVTIDDQSKRLVWTAEGGRTIHYNASLQVAPNSDGTSTITWIADFLPDSVEAGIASAMEAGITAMRSTLELAD